MIRKKIDSRIKILVENCVKLRHRSFFFIVGDNAKEQVVNLHYMLAKARVKSRPNVLWCYKKNLGFISDDRSRIKQLRKIQKKKKKKDKEETLEDFNDPFHLFLAATDIRFCYFKETKNILGQTFGMLVMQDFEAITPNILARTIETVEGGGMIIFLAPTVDSLKKLYSITMDVHSRFRTDAQQEVVPRFNERFMLSLASNKNCLVVDDELNILPISAHIKDIKPIELGDSERDQNHIISPKEKEFKELVSSLRETQPVGPLISIAKTLDQAKAILQFIEAISEKTLQTTVSLTAARGRGKSAALGIAIGAAVAFGYSNIFITAPTPENLKTLFEFIFKAFDALGYKDQLDYEIVQSTNPSFNKAIVRVNIFREHRQTIQYINPNDYQKLGQAELLVIDEAAAIPLPVVRNLLGNYLIFISSTINGYEGTGRSLSLKLIKQLREKSTEAYSKESTSSGRKLHEIKLEEPIRYAEGDLVERWLYDLLCLDATAANLFTSKCPHPDQCDLYYVNRDTLFSYHAASESFLHNMMALYVSSHYKNTPNDLQLMSDAPGHHLFVLLGPIDENTTTLPDIYCVIQVAMEGKINRETIMRHLRDGTLPSGDLIPYLVSRQFQESDFNELSGIRIVRIATHPDFQRMGYGTRALQLLIKYYKGELLDLDEEEDSNMEEEEEAKQPEETGLQKENIKPRDKLPSLLQTLTQRPPEKIHYIGTSFGLTQSLFNYWQKNGLKPIYVRMTPNEVTGEHTCVMLKDLTDSTYLDEFYNDFRRRFINLLSYKFRDFPPALGLSLIGFKQPTPTELETRQMTVQELDSTFTSFDLKRLTSYSKSLLDYHIILDLVPKIARLYFLEKLPFSISYAQAAILLAVGLQCADLNKVDLNIENNQKVAIFNKIIRKTVTYLQQVDKQRFVQTTNDQSSSKKEKTKKRKLEEQNDEEEEKKETKKKKSDYKDKQFVKYVLSNDAFKMTGVVSEDLEGATGDIVTARTEREGKEEFGGRAKATKRMLKSKEELEAIKKAERQKLYKRGGKKKRKILKQ